MMIRLLKTYTLTVTIQEANDEFWESIKDGTGCDLVVAEVRGALCERGFAPDTGCQVRLAKFEERGPL